MGSAENERASTKKFNSTLNQQKKCHRKKQHLQKHNTSAAACLLPQTNFWHIIMQLWETSGCSVLVVAVFEAFFFAVKTGPILGVGVVSDSSA